MARRDGERPKTQGVRVFGTLSLIGAVLADQHDEWAIARRYLSETSMTELDAPRDTDDQQPALAG
jgi:hypothetical protein